MDYEISLPLGAVLSLILTIVLYVKIMPRKKDGKFQKSFHQFLHDYFHFKKLYLEEVLKWVFTLATVGCVVCGALLLISVDPYGWYSSYSGWHSESTFGYGIALMLGGPIALRLSYELLMMFILLVKNVMEINNTLKAASQEPEDTFVPYFEQ